MREILHRSSDFCSILVKMCLFSTCSKSFTRLVSRFHKLCTSHELDRPKNPYQPSDFKDRKWRYFQRPWKWCAQIIFQEHFCLSNLGKKSHELERKKREKENAREGSKTGSQIFSRRTASTPCLRVNLRLKIFLWYQQVPEFLLTFGSLLGSVSFASLCWA